MPEAANRLGIPQNTISSKLTPELQKDLVTGARKVEHVRNLGKLSVEEQLARADERAEAARIKAEAQTRPAVERSAGPADYHGVIIPEATPTDAAAAPAPGPAPAQAGSRASASRPGTPAPPTEHEPAATESIPVPRADAGEPVPANAEATAPKQPKRLPYDDAFYCVHHLHKRMTAETFVRGGKVWMDILRDQHPEEYKALLAELGAR
ncbi:hypothetical protein [Streptomyces sp. enrichment culture]|uniref:hypothetical protein n=1 Tax=Streptomyces sp. enrichment culture TaxID=1795815 RepID=UPI003F54B4BA